MTALSPVHAGRRPAARGCLAPSATRCRTPPPARGAQACASFNDLGHFQELQARSSSAHHPGYYFCTTLFAHAELATGPAQPIDPARRAVHPPCKFCAYNSSRKARWRGIAPLPWPRWPLPPPFSLASPPIGTHSTIVSRPKTLCPT